MTYSTHSTEETKKLGYELGKTLSCGDIIALNGELGAGKTAFTSGIAESLDIFEPITSPTFTIVNEYSGSLPLYHFDAYRIEQMNVNDSQWLDEYLFGDGICVIEWADNINGILPANTIYIDIIKDYEKGENYREIQFKKGNIQGKGKDL